MPLKVIKAMEKAEQEGKEFVPVPTKDSQKSSFKGTGKYPKAPDYNTLTEE